MPAQLDWTNSKLTLYFFLKASLILVGVSLVFFGFVTSVGAINFTLKVNVKNGSGQNITGAFVAVQRCGAWNETCGFDPDGSIILSEVIRTAETDSQGNVQFNDLEINYNYQIVATKDYYTCSNSCIQSVAVTSSQTVNKNFTLDAPDLTQVTDYGCTLADVANGTSTQRPRNNEEQRKVTENGVYWSTSYSYTNTIKWMKIFSSDCHSWNFPLQAAPDAPLPQSSMGFSGNIFKLDQRCFIGRLPGECGTGDYTQAEITQTAKTNPGSWWIMGEEPNSKNIVTAMAPISYAMWYHDKTQLVLKEDRTAKFIFGYLAQRYPQNETNFSDPVIYARQVMDEWKTLASQNNWCPEPPIDAIHGNFFPFLQYDGTDLPSNDTKANPAHLFAYTHRWRDFLYDGTADAWLANERLSIGTGPLFDITSTLPIQESANYYNQAAVGRLLVTGKNKYPFMLFLMNYAGFAVNSFGHKLKSNQQEAFCRPSLCSYPNPANGVTSYGRVFANFIFRNAGWEKGNLENWKQEDSSGSTIDTYGVITSAYPTPQKTFYITDTVPFTTNITSFTVAEFVDDSVTSCASNQCWLRSDKNPLPALSGQAATFRYGIDYRVTNGTAKIRLQMRFYDSTGNTQIGSDMSCITGFVSAGSWTPLECPEATTPNSPSYPSRVQLSVRIIPQTAGTNTKVRLDNAWGRFEAP